jgi:hypothetical protein
VTRARLATAAAALALVAGAAGCGQPPDTHRGTAPGTLHTSVSAQDIVDGFADPGMFCHESLREFAQEWGPHGPDWPTAAAVYRELQERC